MIITLIIFCTVVTGIAGMQDLKKVGRVGGKALLYFEIVSTLALLIGLVVGNVVRPGSGFNVDAATLDAKAVADYAGQAKAQSVTDFLMHIIPTTVVDAFAKGDILEVVFVAILFGFALSAAGARGKPLVDLFDALDSGRIRRGEHLDAVRSDRRIRRHGIHGWQVRARVTRAAGQADRYVLAHFHPVCAARAGRDCVGRWIQHLSISGLHQGRDPAGAGHQFVGDRAARLLMEKMERLGCSKSLVGLVVPTGYTFNTDGTSLYMTLAALFVAQATNTHLTLMQQLTILSVAILTSKGASGVQGAAFIALVATLSVIPTIPVAGMALILGDRPLHEHVPRLGQHDRQRRGDAGDGALGG